MIYLFTRQCHAITLFCTLLGPLVPYFTHYREHTFVPLPPRTCYTHATHMLPTHVPLTTCLGLPFTNTHLYCWFPTFTVLPFTAFCPSRSVTVLLRVLTVPCHLTHAPIPAHPTLFCHIPTLHMPLWTLPIHFTTRCLGPHYLCHCPHPALVFPLHLGYLAHTHTHCTHTFLHTTHTPCYRMPLTPYSSDIAPCLGSLDSTTHILLPLQTHATTHLPFCTSYILPALTTRLTHYTHTRYIPL